jgi:nucleoside-diphosphate kinase
MIEKTLAIIKPDAVKKRIIGKIIAAIEEDGFRITEMKMIRLSKEDARAFYAVHKGKSFFDALTDFMSSGEIVAMVLEGENAISRWRQIMGETDPAKAKVGTLRRIYGFSIERNAVHGSDSQKTADWEVHHFFGI